MPQVKVLFEAEKEIRRFILPASGAFEDLVGKVRGVLGNDVNFRLFWKDAEGDSVVCESAAEFQTALDHLAALGNETELLRIHVRVTGPAASSAPSTASARSIFDEVTVEDDMETDQAPERPTASAPASENKKPEEKAQEKTAEPPKKEEPPGPKEHVGVSCDGCGERVIGTRFKCTKCPDYDLCETCKGKGYHLEHELEPITEPRAREEYPDNPWMNMMFGGGPRRHGRHHHGRHHGFAPFAPFAQMGGFPRQPAPGGMFNSQNATANGSASASASSSTSTGGPGGCSTGGSAFAGDGGWGPWARQFGQNCAAGGNMPKSVDEIAQQLKDMGITADGGVIRDLIEQFQGDIRKIIEVMS